MTSPNNTRQKAERFRVLIIGNANAGKTTILEKVCHANGRKPKFLGPEGEEITSELKASAERGEHDIEHQIVYPTAHGFIFHDSRGFEAGGTNELDKVKGFIEQRAKKVQMKDQLHAIWCCLPTSSDRPLTKAEMSLFESSTGNVPVIAVFTKMDALDKKVFSEEFNKHGNFSKAKEQIPTLARGRFEQDYLAPLKKATHQPNAIVELREMNKQDKHCDKLIRETAKALDKQALTLLLLTAQRNDVEFSIKEVISLGIIPLAQEVLQGGKFSDNKKKSLLRGAMSLFSHSLPSFHQQVQNMDKNAISAMDEGIEGRRRERLQFQQERREQLQLQFQRREQAEQQEFQFGGELLQFNIHDNNSLQRCLKSLLGFLPSIPSYVNDHCSVISLGFAIIFPLVSSLFSSTLSPPELSPEKFLEHFESALQIYHNSPSSKDLAASVNQKFQQCQCLKKEDGDQLFKILMDNPLFSEILLVN